MEEPNWYKDANDEEISWILMDLYDTIKQLNRRRETDTKFLLLHSSEMEAHLKDEHKADFFNMIYREIRNSEIKMIFKNSFKKYFRLAIINDLLTD